MAASRVTAGKTKALPADEAKNGHGVGAKNAPARKAASPAGKRRPSADEAKHRLFSEKVRKLRHEAEELVASADRLLSRLS